MKFRGASDARHLRDLIIVAPKHPSHKSHDRTAQMREGRDRADSRDLFPGTDRLKQNPKKENRPGGQSNPSKPYIPPAEEKSEFCVRKFKGIERDDAGN